MFAAAARDVEKARRRTVGVKVEREKAAGRIGRRADHHGARRVAEEHACVAVFPIDEPGQKLGADHEDALRAATNELVGDIQSVKRSGAGR